MLHRIAGLTNFVIQCRYSTEFFTIKKTDFWSKSIEQDIRPLMSFVLSFNEQYSSNGSQLIAEIQCPCGRPEGTRQRKHRIGNSQAIPYP